MKSVGVSVNLSGTSVLPFCDIIGGTGEEVCHVIFDREQDQDATFWKVLSTFNTEDDANKRVQIFLLDVFYASLTQETRQLFINETFQRSLIYIDMPFMNVKETQTAVDEINIYAEQSYPGGISSSPLIGVAAVTIAVNELIVGSQWTSLGFALIATLFTLAVVFRDPRFALLTTLPVVFTVAMQWLVMQQMDVTLSLVTVMIGSILVGVGIDFSIHIANRIREQGGTIEAVREACTTTGMSLIEAVFVTCLGLATAFFIPIPALKPFVLTIIILLIVAASSALLLLPAIFTFLIESGVGLVGGSASMMRAARLIAKGEDEEVVLAAPTQRTDHDSW
jgi:predicted RND superfamily exporter protein